jgi:hypothetical protein
VRLLANELSAQIPVIASTLMENQVYTATGPGHGSRTGFMKDGEFHIAHRKEADGSLILSTPATRKTISRMLAKEGYDTQFINEALARFDSGPENVQIELSPTRTAVKWEVTGLQMALDGPPIDPAVPVKTAFEFLALHIGGRIYDRSPPVDEIRRALLDGNLDPDRILVERLEAPSALAFHGIAFEGNGPHVTVQLRLFGKLAFRVHFRRIAVRGRWFQYTHELDTGREFVSQINARAKLAE